MIQFFPLPAIEQKQGYLAYLLGNFRKFLTPVVKGDNKDNDQPFPYSK
jgi:hypothetical protein